MPKLKSRKGARKRFRITANGKMKRRQAGKSKLLSHKSGKRKRHLRVPVVKSDKMARKLMRAMGGVA